MQKNHEAKSVEVPEGEISKSPRRQSLDIVRSKEAETKSDTAVDSASVRLRTERLHYVEAMPKRLIGLDRFLPDHQKEGRAVAPVRHGEVIATIDFFRPDIDRNTLVNTITLEGLRASSFLVKHGLEKLHTSLLKDSLTDEQKQDLSFQAQRVEQMYQRTKYVGALRDTVYPKVVEEYLKLCSGCIDPSKGWKMLYDIKCVGQEEEDKPMSYMPAKVIEMVGQTREQIEEEAKKNGHCVYYAPDPTYPRLYKYDPEEVKNVIERNRHVLDAVGWSADPHDFVKLVSEKTVEPHTALYTVIADAFGDYNNPGRIDVFNPARDHPEQDKHLPMAVLTIRDKIAGLREQKKKASDG